MKARSEPVEAPLRAEFSKNRKEIKETRRRRGPLSPRGWMALIGALLLIGGFVGYLVIGDRGYVKQDAFYYPNGFPT